MNDVELLALLQHEGAATRFLDVTPDPFIALFFACEGAAVPEATSAALIAIRVDKRQVVPDEIPASEGGKAVLDQVRAAGSYSDAENLMLWQPPPLNERIKVQRGMFVIGPVTEGLPYGSIDLRLLTNQQGEPDKDKEKKRVEAACEPRQGRPPSEGRASLVVLRIAPEVRRELQRILSERFGYRTETIYPDLNGFARANAAEARL